MSGHIGLAQFCFEQTCQFREFFICRGCGVYSDGLGGLRRLNRRFGLRFETVFGPMFGA
jgi:hypothetical protein